jgi:hypothetical protein
MGTAARSKGPSFSPNLFETVEITSVSGKVKAALGPGYRPGRPQCFSGIGEAALAPVLSWQTVNSCPFDTSCLAPVQFPNLFDTFFAQ